jgi:copper chaperone NosL
MSKMSLPSRIIIAIGSLSLIATFYLPVWFIFLIAPQYPEGLTMNIWLNKITGQVDIINGLNHYIGMKHIKAEMFPEFGYLVYIVGFFIALGLLVAIAGRRKLLFYYLILTVLGGIAAMVDFFKWGYDYGHNLDPKAAIQVPGLYYQPPLVGHKTLLNFDAYSYPDIGGWVVIGVGILFFLVYFFELYRSKKIKPLSIKAKKTIPAIGMLIILLSSCNAQPSAFNIGKDNCDDCKMTIMDAKFGGEIITKKGRVYKFDDAHCLANFIKSNNVKKEEIAGIAFMNYENPNTFLKAESAFFVVSPQLKSPMNSNAAAFANEQAAQKTAKEANGVVENWTKLSASL